jgi:hypothetical protein
MVESNSQKGLFSTNDVPQTNTTTDPITGAFDANFILLAKLQVYFFDDTYGGYSQ